MNKKDSIIALFPQHLMKYFYNITASCDNLQEIRIRRNGPIQLVLKNALFYVAKNGQIVKEPDRGATLETIEFDDLFSHICRHSIYAFEQELIKGYMTVEGGHRVGVVGQIVWDGAQIKGIKYFTAINIRIAHEIKGVADDIISYLYDEYTLKSTLVVSLPGCGKTTLLRDLVRKISNGSRRYMSRTVSLIDERSEIAACYLGVPQNDVGIHTDILDACPKAVGILQVLRSMSPQVIAVDELGGEEDYNAMQQAFFLGCNIIATIHGTDYERLKSNPYMCKMLKKGCFERVVILQGRVGDRQKRIVCNEKGEVLNIC